MVKLHINDIPSTRKATSYNVVRRTIVETRGDEYAKGSF